MNNDNLYLARYAWPDQLINFPPDSDLGMVIIIPCYNEQNLINTLLSITYAILPKQTVEVIVIINNAINCTEIIAKSNQNTYETAIEWVKIHSTQSLQFHIHYCNNLPKKHAGVGLARKIGMDEAIRRFETVNNHRNGIIVCFDADSLCEENYLVAIEEHFINHPQTPACSINFEHPTDGEYPKKVYDGIIKYELFLRYYINALRFANFPHAYQTIGSSMAVRSEVYQKQGGMNKRKAGEDFYFLHKIIPLGNFTEINNTKVIPSPRPSDRVPFGTGRAINQWLDNDSGIYRTYNPQTFIDLKLFINQVDQLYCIEESMITEFTKKLPKSIRVFLESQKLSTKIKEINKHCGNTLEAFRIRFFKWFNGFVILKYTHFARDNFYSEISIEMACEWLMKEHFGLNKPSIIVLEQLQVLRKLDREKN